MITLSHINHQVLAIPHLGIREGHTAIIGTNGSGKTTLVELCGGMQRPMSGEVLIDGGEPRECSIGWVNEFPDRNLLFERVFDEIASPLRFQYVSPEKIRQRVEEVCSRLDITDLLDKTIHSLSGGEKTLVAIGTALAAEPSVLVLDEADTHLDGRTADSIQKVIGACGVPHILQVTQHMDTAAEAAELLFMERGSVVYQGPPEEVFALLEHTCFYPSAWRLRT